MKKAGLSVLVALTSIGLIAMAVPRRAAANPTFVVDTAGDAHDANPGDGVCDTGGGVCSLRAAVEEAEALPGADTITFSPGFPNPTTFLLSLGHLTISTEMTITGRGESNTIVDASGDLSPDRVFLMQGSNSVSVAISDLTIQNGAPAPPSFGGGIASGDVAVHLTNVAVTGNAAWDGAGIAGNNLTLDHCTIRSNTAAVLGGGIYGSGAVTILSSTIEGNSAVNGGGGLYVIAGTAHIQGSTVDQNSSAAGGGGLRVSSGGTLTVVETTVTGNISNSDGAGTYVEGSFGGGSLQAFNATITGNQCGIGQAGCGIFLESGGTASIANTILANNYELSKTSAPNDCNGLTSLDYNLVLTLANCTITGATSNNIYGSDPMLSPLQDNGGPTRTKALSTGSPAIDKGNPSGCTDNFGATLTTDQREYVSPINGRCDMGAYEFGSPGPPTPTPTHTFTPTNTRTPTRTATRTSTRTPTVTPLPSPVSPEALVVDPSSGAASDGNGVFEPGETVAVQPAWKNTGASTFSLTGVASSFTGPAGGSYGILDGSASYGSIAAGATASCATGANCYRMTASALGSRPATHWDTTFTETPSSGDPAKVWTLHIGDSFTDVPVSQPFYKKIETILHSGITTGCTRTTYCPADNVPRSQMAIFIAGDGRKRRSGPGRAARSAPRPTTASPAAPRSSPTSRRRTSSASTSTTSRRRT